jgi:hypothetical protein
LIKSFLIVVLSLTLAGAAFATRPTEQDFQAHLKEAKRSSRGMVFRDRFLWVQVEDGRGTVQFTGLFSHWLERGTWGPQRQGKPSDSKVSRAWMLALQCDRD